MNWSTHIRATRERLGLTQDALALALGVTRQTVQNWESGRSEPAHDGMVRLALQRLEEA